MSYQDKNPYLFRPFNSLSAAKVTATAQPAAEGEEAAFDEPVLYQPNTGGNIGISLGYRDFSLAFSQADSVSEDSAQEKGETKYQDLQLHGVSGWIGWDVSWQDYQGFNNQDLLSVDSATSSPDNTKFAFYPDMTLNRRTLNLFYINDPENYNQSAHMYQTGYQKESGDSLVFSAAFDHLKIRNLPSDLINQLPEGSQKSSIDANSFSLLVGYAFVLKHPFGYWFGGSILLGRTWQYQKPISEISFSAQTSVPANKEVVLLSLGLDRGYWFLGASLWQDSVTVPLDAVEYQLNSVINEIYLGIRL